MIILLYFQGMKGKKIDAIFACVGGGGLLSGIAAYIKGIYPDIRIIGVEAADAAGMTESLRAGKVITLPTVGLFADGAAVRTVGQETYRVCNQLVDEMVTVQTDEICAAIKLCFNDTRCVLEPAGALAIAGMVKYTQAAAASGTSSSSNNNNNNNNNITGQTFVAISSGANMDFDRLRFVSERADASETLMSITIPEKPGAFRALYQLIYPRNVTEFSYRHNGRNTANVFVSFQALVGTSIRKDKETIQHLLTTHGYTVEDLSNNELAKAHGRHLSGGRSYQTWGNEFTELLFRFEFPEAPGALDKFLHTLNHFNQGWSISLFHYRNHGHDYGRVLVGLLVQSNERQAFDEFLTNLGYSYYEETNNHVYQQFLR
jgi:threonine dehydratase